MRGSAAALQPGACLADLRQGAAASQCLLGFLLGGSAAQPSLGLSSSLEASSASLTSSAAHGSALGLLEERKALHLCAGCLLQPLLKWLELRFHDVALSLGSFSLAC